MKPKHPSRQHLGLVIVAFAAAGLSQSASSATYDWIGATNTTWDASWTGGNVPTISDDLTILGPSNSAALLNIDVASNAFAKSINFTNTFATTLTNTTSGANKTLTLQNGLTTGTGAVTIGSTTSNQGVLIALGASQIWNIGSGGLTANNIISGTGFGITKTGEGILTLAGANTYTGGTTISAGILSVGNVANNQNLGASTSGVTLDGGTLRTTHSANANGIFGTRTLTIGASGGTLNVNGTATTGQNSRVQINTANTLLGSGALAITGNGSLDGFGGGRGVVVVSAAQTYNGAITLSGGGLLAIEGGGLGSGATIEIGNNAELSIGTGVTVNNNIAVTGGTASQMSWTNGGTGILAGTLTLNANLNIGMRNWYSAAAQNGTISGVVSGAGNLTISGGGTLALSGANDYTGTTNISSGILSTGSLSNGGSSSGIGASSNAAGNLVLNGGTLKYTGGAVSTDRLFSLQSNSTIDSSGTGAVNFTNAGSIGFNGGTAAKTLTLTGTNTGANTLASAMGDNTGTTSILKSGAGNWSITHSASTFTGSIQVQGGVLNWSGSNTSVIASNGGGWLAVGTSGNGRLNITGGNLTRYDVGIGGATTVGAVYQSAGSLTVQRVANTGDFRLGDAVGAYGYYKLSGNASLTTNEIGIGGIANGTTGVMDIAGGTLTSNGWIALGRGGTTSSGVLNVTGGIVEFSKTAGAADTGNSKLALQWGGSSGAQSIVNISNGTVTGDDYVDLATTNAAGTLGAINLLSGGVLQGSRVTANAANPTALLNFNGGTLKANGTNAGVNFMNSANIDAVTVYSGGGTIDNNATSITIGKALAAATGNGITAIGVTTKGSGYLGAPMVTISGGTGNTATGYAVMEDDGTGNGTFRVASIVISSPGTYTADPSAVTLTGGGATTAASGFSISMVANTSGGMTFQGSGTTTLTGANTYNGTTINAGTLTVVAGGTLGATTGALSVNNTNAGAGTNVVLNLATAVDTTVGSLSGTVGPAGSGTNTATINNGGSGRNFIINQTAAGIYGGVIAGAGNVTLGSLSTKALTLSGTNTYNGTTAIDAGKIVVSGSIGSSAVAVTGTGSTLASGTTGTIGSSVTMNNGTILAAGDVNAVGTATVGSGGLAMSTGSIFDWDLQAASATDPGVGASNAATGTYDKVVASGAVSGTSAIFKVVLAGNSFADAFWDTNKSWTDIFTGAGAPADLSTIFTTFSGSGGINSTGLVAGQGQFTFNGSSTLSWSAVPEPSNASIAALLIGAGLLRRNRRRKSGDLRADISG